MTKEHVATAQTSKARCGLQYISFAAYYFLPALSHAWSRILTSQGDVGFGITILVTALFSGLTFLGKAVNGDFEGPGRGLVLRY